MQNYKKVALEYTQKAKKSIWISLQQNEIDKSHANAAQIGNQAIIEAITTCHTTSPEMLYHALHQYLFILESSPLTNYDKMRLAIDLIQIILNGFIEQDVKQVVPYTAYEELLKHEIQPKDVKKELILSELSLDAVITDHHALDAFIEYTRKYIITKEQLEEIKKTLQEEYYDKKGHPTTIGYEKIIQAITIFDTDKKVLKLIQEELKKQIKEEPIKKHTPIKKVQRLPIAVTNQKWRELQNKVKKYYNLRDKSPVRPLNIQEKIELTILLREMLFTNEEIKQILKQIEMQYPSPITSKEKNIMQNAFNIYHVWKKIMTSELAEEEKEELCAIRKEMISTTDKEDKWFWKTTLFENILKETETMKGNFDYELNIARKRKTSSK